jgi:hypothetical protein
MSAKNERLPQTLDFLIAPYEFEDRADFFVKEIEQLSESLKEILIEAENKTRTDLQMNSRILSALTKTRNTARIPAIMNSDYKTDVESADLAKAVVCIYGNKRGPIENFSLRIDKLAKRFRGMKTVDDGIKSYGRDYPDGEFKFYLYSLYVFK